MPPTMAGSSIPTRRPHNPLVHRTTTTTTNMSNTGPTRIPWQQHGVGGGRQTKRKTTRTSSLSSVLLFVLVVVFVIFIAMNYYVFSSITTTTTPGTPAASATGRKEQHRPNQINSVNITTTTTTNTDGNAVMILAAVPLDSRHVVALWSELECFAAPDARITTVILAAPLWCQPMLDFLIAQVQNRIPQFRSTNTTKGTKYIEARYFTNDRYDVGLWCDGLHSLGFVSSNYYKNNTTTTTANHNNNNNNNDDNNNNRYDTVVLLNDSLFALRPFTAILDFLQPAQLHDPELRKYSSLTALNTTEITQTQKTIHMTSLSYSLTDPEGIWLESVYRGFDRYGIQRYLDHSCPSEGAAHPSFCPHVIDRIEKKRCIINNHEIAIARLFVQDPEDPPAATTTITTMTTTETKNTSTTTMTANRHVVGLYPADVPRSMWKPHLPDYQTWTRHMEYWKDTLVGHMDFPAGKVSKRNAIRRALHDPLLQHCTAHFDRTLLDDHPHIFNFTNGIRTISKH